MPAALATPACDAPFDHLAETYDAVFTNSLIGRAQRDSVWEELDRCFHPGQRIVEINCGTGVDAVHLAERGVEVVACDVAPRMIQVARQRLTRLKAGARVDFRVLATEQIAELAGEGPFDGVFSNFAGLNCVPDLSTAARDLARLLAPGATALLCMAGHTVAWEIIWYMGQGNPRKALRRFERGGTIGRIAEGVTVEVHYPSPRTMAHIFAPEFRLVRLKGVGVTVPPSYLEPLARRFPRVLRTLAGADRVLSRLPVIRALADHLLLEFQRVDRCVIPSAARNFALLRNLRRPRR
jgi:ubiquinone/menaquinone biosynthesis C-methylase UbiE